MAMKMRTYTVRGRLPFPLDMLRYDSCWPDSAVDTTQIAESLARVERKVYTVHLSSYNAPTIARWNSFSWGVE